MTASRTWALVVGFVILALGLAGGAAWMRDRAPTNAPVARAVAPADEKPVVARQDPATEQAPALLPAAQPPRFDIVRVEPSGETVVAGKGEANGKVALLAEGAVVAETTADSSGHFVMLPKALPPGDHSLSLRQTMPNQAMPKDAGSMGAGSMSAQSVTVVVPERGKGSVVVALAEPGQATKVLSAPAAVAPAPVAQPPSPAEAKEAPKDATKDGPRNAPKAEAKGDPNAKVAVRAVDLEHGDGFHASGAAAPGTPVTVYLNNAHIADVIAGTDGQWTVTIKKGLAGGHYVVRADAGPTPEPADKGQADKAQADLGQTDTAHARSVTPQEPARAANVARAAVVARAEVPFDVPVTSVTPPDARRPGRPDVTIATATTAGTTGNAGNAVIEEIQTARVVDGDNLWNISLSRLGQATRYTQIYAANEKQIRDPNLIYPGQVFVLPR